MNVSLPEELEELVQRQVESGRYGSASEVIQAGLRLLDQEDALRERWIADTRAQVRDGIEQAERGHLVDGEEAVARVKKRAAVKRRGPRRRGRRPETCMALRGEECGAPAGIPAATSRRHHSLKSMV